MNTKWENIGDDWRKKIIFLDTTLRDWHQCPGAWIESDKDYFDIVRWLDDIGFDICEVWFPSSSKNEWRRVNEVAKMCKNWEISTIVWWLTQMIDFQVESTLKALEPLSWIKKGFFHIYFPFDPELRKASIWNKISDNQVLKDIAKFSKMAYDMWFIVQFSPEWYSKIWKNFGFCTEAMIAAWENGTTYFNMPDTIWWQDIYNKNEEYFLEKIKKHIEIMNKVFPENKFIFSVHNHNDLWTAEQNSIEALLKWTWISKVETTINWIWERAWNADSNQIIVRMKTTLKNIFDIDHINASNINRVSKMVSKSMLKVQDNYPVVWGNAMKHTSGWHTRAMLKNPCVYQAFDPELVWSKISFIYWPNSGWNLAISIINSKWYSCSHKNKRSLDEFLKKKMRETGRYKWITDEELLELYFEYVSPIKISNYSKNNIEWDKNISVIFEWEIFGKNSLELKWETVFIWLKEYISRKIPWYSVLDYSSKSETLWERSRAETRIRVKKDNSWKISEGIGVDNDTEMALLKALENVFNIIYFESKFKLERN